MCQAGGNLNLIVIGVGNLKLHVYDRDLEKKNVGMQRTRQQRLKLLGQSVARSLVKEMLKPDVTLTLSADKTKYFIARLVPVIQHKDKIY